MSVRKEFRELVDPADARESIDSLPIDPGTTTVPLEKAHDRILAERIDATIDVPGFDRATVDGYAVRSADVVGADEGTPVLLDQVGTVHAGERATESIDTGETIEISTGAVMPPGANAVVMVERTRMADSGIAIEQAVAPGDHVMAAGTDIPAGHRTIGPGRQLTARDIALLAALGYETVPVRRRPRVGVISTGDELVRPGATLDTDRGQVFDVNSHTLVAAIEAAGGEPVLYPHVGDDAEDMQAMLERAATDCDLVCSSGSTSASAVDVIYRVIESRGEILHHGVAVKPGKPMLIGTIGDNSAYIGLPGFPVSALMTFRQFVAPRIREAAGLTDNDASVPAIMASEERFSEGRMRLLPVGIVDDGSGQIVAYPVDKGSGATTSLAHADGVVEVPPDTAFVSENEAVTVNLFEPGSKPPSLLVVGEADPALYDLLDGVSSPRLLPVGSVEGARRFDREIPDVAALAGGQSVSSRVHRIAEWSRTWGIAMNSEIATRVDDIHDLIEIGPRFANLGSTALRAELDGLLDQMAEDRDIARTALIESLPGYELGRPGIESAVRRIIAGDAGAGLALESTARDLSVEFLPCGRQSVRLVARPERREKAGIAQLEAGVKRTLPTILRETPGYHEEPSTGQ